MNAPVVIATLPKNSRERVRIALDTHQHHNLLDIRVMVQIAVSGNAWTPTKIGVSIQAGQIPELIKTLHDAETRAREMGWIGGDA